ncbi:MAG: hypothetical protein KIT76_18625 [Pseudolabrys sp.]|nr:hypothetical protein [Pseudolabrys sp.]
MTTKWLLSATTALALLATPALAADDSAKGTNNAEQAIDKALNDRNAADASEGATATNRAAESGEAAGEARGDRPKSDRAMAQRRLRQALKQAGFTDVRILGATYRIRARDEDGNTVFMRINPGAMDRHGMKHGMSKHDMDRGGTERSMDRSMADDGDDMASDDMNHGGMHHGGMGRDGMNGAETTGAGDRGKAYGAGPMEPRGEGGGYGNSDGRTGAGDAFAYDRAYDQGFRDGYARGFDRAHGWR